MDRGRDKERDRRRDKVILDYGHNGAGKRVKYRRGRGDDNRSGSDRGEPSKDAKNTRDPVPIPRQPPPPPRISIPPRPAPPPPILSGKRTNQEDRSGKDYNGFTSTIKRSKLDDMSGRRDGRPEPVQRFQVPKPDCPLPPAILVDSESASSPDVVDAPSSPDDGDEPDIVILETKITKQPQAKTMKSDANVAKEGKPKPSHLALAGTLPGFKDPQSQRSISTESASQSQSVVVASKSDAPRLNLLKDVDPRVRELMTKKLMGLKDRIPLVPSAQTKLASGSSNQTDNKKPNPVPDASTTKSSIIISEKNNNNKVVNSGNAKERSGGAIITTRVPANSDKAVSKVAIVTSKSNGQCTTSPEEVGGSKLKTYSKSQSSRGDKNNSASISAEKEGADHAPKVPASAGSVTRIKGAIPSPPHNSDKARNPQTELSKDTSEELPLIRPVPLSQITRHIPRNPSNVLIEESTKNNNCENSTISAQSSTRGQNLTSSSNSSKTHATTTQHAKISPSNQCAKFMSHDNILARELELLHAQRPKEPAFASGEELLSVLLGTEEDDQESANATTTNVPETVTTSNSAELEEGELDDDESESNLSKETGKSDFNWNVQLSPTINYYNRSRHEIPIPGLEISCSSSDDAAIPNSTHLDVAVSSDTPAQSADKFDSCFEKDLLVTPVENSSSEKSTGNTMTNSPEITGCDDASVSPQTEQKRSDGEATEPLAKRPRLEQSQSVVSPILESDTSKGIDVISVDAGESEPEGSSELPIATASTHSQPVPELLDSQLDKIPAFSLPVSQKMIVNLCLDVGGVLCRSPKENRRNSTDRSAGVTQNPDRNEESIEVIVIGPDSDSTSTVQVTGCTEVPEQSAPTNPPVVETAQGTTEIILRTQTRESTPTSKVQSPSASIETVEPDAADDEDPVADVDAPEPTPSAGQATETDTAISNEPTVNRSVQTPTSPMDTETTGPDQNGQAHTSESDHEERAAESTEIPVPTASPEGPAEPLGSEILDSTVIASAPPGISQSVQESEFHEEHAVLPIEANDDNTPSMSATTTADDGEDSETFEDAVENLEMEEPSNVCVGTEIALNSDEEITVQEQPTSHKSSCSANSNETVAPNIAKPPSDTAQTNSGDENFDSCPLSSVGVEPASSSNQTILDPSFASNNNDNNNNNNSDIIRIFQLDEPEVSSRADQNTESGSTSAAEIRKGSNSECQVEMVTDSVPQAPTTPVGTLEGGSTPPAPTAGPLPSLNTAATPDDQVRVSPAGAAMSEEEAPVTPEEGITGVTGDRIGNNLEQPALPLDSSLSYLTLPDPSSTPEISSETVESLENSATTPVHPANSMDTEGASPLESTASATENSRDKTLTAISTHRDSACLEGTASQAVATTGSESQAEAPTSTLYEPPAEEPGVDPTPILITSEISPSCSKPAAEPSYPVLRIVQDNGDSATVQLATDDEGDDDDDDCVVKVRKDLFAKEDLADYPDLPADGVKARKIRTLKNHFFRKMSEQLLRVQEEIERATEDTRDSVASVDEMLEKFYALTQSQFRIIDQIKNKAFLIRTNAVEACAKAGGMGEPKAELVDPTALFTVDAMSEYFQALLLMDSVPRRRNSSLLDAMCFHRHRICRIMHFFCKQRSGREEGAVINAVDLLYQNFYKLFPNQDPKWTYEHITRCWDAVRLFSGELDERAIKLDHEKIGPGGFLKKAKIMVVKFTREIDADPGPAPPPSSSAAAAAPAPTSASSRPSNNNNNSNNQGSGGLVEGHSLLPPGLLGVGRLSPITPPAGTPAGLPSPVQYGNLARVISAGVNGGSGGNIGGGTLSAHAAGGGGAAALGRPPAYPRNGTQAQGQRSSYLQNRFPVQQQQQQMHQQRQDIVELSRRRSLESASPGIPSPRNSSSFQHTTTTATVHHGPQPRLTLQRQQQQQQQQQQQPPGVQQNTQQHQGMVQAHQHQQVVFTQNQAQAGLKTTMQQLQQLATLQQRQSQQHTLVQTSQSYAAVQQQQQQQSQVQLALSQQLCSSSVLVAHGQQQQTQTQGGFQFQQPQQHVQNVQHQWRNVNFQAGAAESLRNGQQSQQQQFVPRQMQATSAGQQQEFGRTGNEFEISRSREELQILHAQVRNQQLQDQQSQLEKAQRAQMHQQQQQSIQHIQNPQGVMMQQQQHQSTPHLQNPQGVLMLQQQSAQHLQNPQGVLMLPQQQSAQHLQNPQGVLMLQQQSAQHLQNSQAVLIQQQHLTQCIENPQGGLLQYHQQTQSFSSTSRANPLPNIRPSSVGRRLVPLLPHSTNPARQHQQVYTNNNGANVPRSASAASNVSYHAHPPLNNNTNNPGPVINVSFSSAGQSSSFAIPFNPGINCPEAPNTESQALLPLQEVTNTVHQSGGESVAPQPALVARGGESNVGSANSVDPSMRSNHHQDDLQSANNNADRPESSGSPDVNLLFSLLNE